MEAVFAFARQHQCPVVAFDLEHTGGRKETRGITDIGLCIAHPSGELESRSSLVKPAEHCVFEPYVCRLTGIWPATVADAPSWCEVMQEHLLPYTDAIWVGFNSRSCDMPVLVKECEQAGAIFAVAKHLDLMRIKAVAGSLSSRIAQLVPNISTDGAHRAAFDAELTMLLLDAHLRRGEVMPDMLTGGASPKRKQKAGASTQEEFLVAPGKLRRGAPWSTAEVAWLVAQFSAQPTVPNLEELAGQLGRTPYGVFCALRKAQVPLSEHLVARFTQG